MNTDVILLLIIVLVVATLVVLNILVWLRPEALVKSKGPSLVHSGVATFIAVALFLSCFLMGVWISVLKLQGKLGVYL